MTTKTAMAKQTSQKMGDCSAVIVCSLSVKVSEGSQPPMAFDFYRNVNNADMRALTAYLRGLRPLPLGGGGS